jgi:hypothetical protein
MTYIILILNYKYQMKFTNFVLNIILLSYTLSFRNHRFHNKKDNFIENDNEEHDENLTAEQIIRTKG